MEPTPKGKTAPSLWKWEMRPSRDLHCHLLIHALNAPSLFKLNHIWLSILQEIDSSLGCWGFRLPLVLETERRLKTNNSLVDIEQYVEGPNQTDYRWSYLATPKKNGEWVKHRRYIDLLGQYVSPARHSGITEPLQRLVEQDTLKVILPQYSPYFQDEQDEVAHLSQLLEQKNVCGDWKDIAFKTRTKTKVKIGQQIRIRKEDIQTVKSILLEHYEVDPYARGLSKPANEIRIKITPDRKLRVYVSRKRRPNPISQSEPVLKYPESASHAQLASGLFDAEEWSGVFRPPQEEKPHIAFPETLLVPAVLTHSLDPPSLCRFTDGGTVRSPVWSPQESILADLKVPWSDRFATFDDMVAFWQEITEESPMTLITEASDYGFR